MLDAQEIIKSEQNENQLEGQMPLSHQVLSDKALTNDGDVNLNDQQDDRTANA